MKPLAFVIAGAQKAGTTALAEFLGEHPAIEMANPKEPHLFDNPDLLPSAPDDSHWKEKLSQRYEACFSGSEGLLRGEATPIYLYYQDIAAQLYRYNPALKVIVLLRDPVARAYSHYRMEFARGNESLSYWRALWLEKQRLTDDEDRYASESAYRRHSYRDRGLYSEQLQTLFNVFPESQMLVVSNEALKQSHSETLGRIFRFLEVEPAEITPRTVFSGDGDISEVPFSSWLLRLSFRRELARLQKLVGFDVSHWR